MDVRVAKRFYNAIADSAADLPFTQRSVRLFDRCKSEIEALHIAGKDCLELCCGNGRFSFLMEGLGGILTGVDCAEKPIEIARAVARERGSRCEFILDDVLHLDTISQRFDYIFLLQHNIVEFSPADVAVLAQGAVSVLKPDGKFCIWLKDEDSRSEVKSVDVFEIPQKGSFPYESWHWGTDKTVKLFGAYFKTVTVTRDVYVSERGRHDWIVCQSPDDKPDIL